ncbi:hypothetical protein CDL15_Pgr012702 [Punica granatum]|uniref:Uncharacterized protein n=1 Tax=Punica granatum TaxID=22663 RepID=A0A218XFG2_PUNGR|nr:hypothetical protein CDL15_Pgr012702 [Punica granatum]
MAVEPAGGGLHSSNRLEGHWAGKLGQVPESWAERAKPGPRKGALGHERERLGRTGPCVWIRLFRADFRVETEWVRRQTGSGRLGWTKLGRTDRRKMGRARERGDERRR